MFPWKKSTAASIARTQIVNAHFAVHMLVPPPDSADATFRAVILSFAHVVVVQRA